MIQTAGRVTFVYISTCGTSGSVWYSRLVVSLSGTFLHAVLAVCVVQSADRCHFRVNFNVQYKQLCVVQTASRITFVYISTCRTSGSVWYTRRVVSLSCTFHRAVLAALCSTDGGSCHFRVHFNVSYYRLCVVHTAGRVTFVYISTCRTCGSA